VTLYEFLKTLHVLAAVAWVGGAILMQLLVYRLRASGPAFGGLFAQSEWLGNRLFMPASIVALVTGIWMTIDAWEFEQAWIVIGLAGIAYSAVTGAAILGPTGQKIGALTAEKGPGDAEVQGLIDKMVRVSRIDLVVLIVVVANMVIKPGA
jgi:uncharacterized membrane protein